MTMNCHEVRFLCKGSREELFCKLREKRSVYNMVDLTMVRPLIRVAQIHFGSVLAGPVQIIKQITSFYLYAQLHSTHLLVFS